MTARMHACSDTTSIHRCSALAQAQCAQVLHQLERARADIHDAPRHDARRRRRQRVGCALQRRIHQEVRCCLERHLRTAHATCRALRQGRLTRAQAPFQEEIEVRGPTSLRIFLREGVTLSKGLALDSMPMRFSGAYPPCTKSWAVVTQQR